MEIHLYDNPLKMGIIDEDLFINSRLHQKNVRTTSEMKEVFYRSTNVADADIKQTDLYYMYRDIMKKNDLRFDVTLIRPINCEGEYAKTYGHYHPKSPDGPGYGKDSGVGGGLEYPEIYHVLHGKAIFVLQKKNRDESVDVIIADAIKGDVILLPPGYGHVSVNADSTGNIPLVLSNLVYDKFTSLYDEYKTNHGAAVYCLTDGELVQNTNYIVKNMRRMNVKEMNRLFSPKFSCKDILSEFIESPDEFEFLARPALMWE